MNKCIIINPLKIQSIKEMSCGKKFGEFLNQFDQYNFDVNEILIMNKV